LVIGVAVFASGDVGATLANIGIEDLGGGGCECGDLNCDDVNCDDCPV
jgi:hypothetical protein